MNDGRPLFAFEFRRGVRHALSDFAEADVAGNNVDFVWVHLDLSDATAQAWLRRRPWPADVIEMVAAPIQRGRLFMTPEMIYGHLRDFRDLPDTVTLQAGSSALLPRGDCSSLVGASRCAPSRSYEAASKRG